MRIEDHIMPECFADTLFIETVAPPKQGGYNHKKSCFKVESEFVNRNNYRGRFIDNWAIGIIDNDKKTIKYLEECKTIDKLGNSLYLFRHSDPNKHHYFIVLSPDLEYFIFDICKEENIELSSHNLPVKINKFKDITRTMVSKNNPNLKSLFTQLNKSKNAKILRIKHWLNFISQNGFNVDINKLNFEN